MDFSNILKDLRESRGVTQDDLAKHLKVSRSTIAGYETRHRQPDYDKLIKISEFFHVSVDYLLTAETAEEITPVLPTPEMEKMLDRKVLNTYKRLGFKSKQDVLAYIELLEMKEQNDKK